MGLSNKGRHLSNEHKNKISAGVKRIGSGKLMLGKKLSQETRTKQSIAQKKRYENLDPEVLRLIGEKISLSQKGKPRFSQRGENHHQWKGGVDYENNKIRHSIEYRLWREAVFSRDNFTCQLCNQRGGRLEADHIKPFSLYPELRLAIDNGRTLCKPCHIKTDTYLGKARRKNIVVI